MPFDPYASCPCGSGKKFKWCCQPIHQEIAKAFRQDEEGQHEAALRLMDEVVAQHADNPEAWGKKALLLWQNEKPEESEAALSKALEINPQYPFGHYLKARFRLFEGEVPGALMLFRKAADNYDPAATHILVEIYLNIFDCEMKLNRPVAAHAAGELALKCDPNNVQLRESLDKVFGDENPNLPRAARRQYKYQPTRKAQAWDQVMAKMASSRLGDALRAFELLAQADPEDPAVWYDLGLTHTWLGNHPAALEALDRYVGLQSDENLAAEAWELAEVLRCGQGMEDQADYVEHSITAQIRDPRSFVELLGQMERDRVVAGLRVDQQQGILAGLVLEPAPVALTPELQSRQGQPLGAFFMLFGNVLRLWNTQEDRVQSAFKQVQAKAAAALGEVFPMRGPAKFQDILAPALVVPVQATDQASHDVMVREHLARYFEETWIHRPLKSLGNVAPVDAAGSAQLRKKLAGVLRFVEEVAALTDKQAPYDFDQLRRKLNLAGPSAPAAAGTIAATPAAALDIGAMGPAELAGLAADSLDEGQLEQGFQTAVRLDAKELAGRFAGALVDRPANAERPDRYPSYNHLINLAVASSDYQEALNRIDAGESHDCSHNEGRRRHDYELRRGQVLLKQGEHGQAEDVLGRLVARIPDDLNVRGKVIEALLSARQGKRALKFAEEGLEAARKQNKRDSEDYFRELADAARRQG